MEKAFVVRGVATQLFTTENSIDAAILEASRLMQSMIEARQQLGLSAVAAADSIAEIAKVHAALEEARAAAVRGHGEMKEIADRLKVRVPPAGYKWPEVGDSTKGLRDVG